MKKENNLTFVTAYMLKAIHEEAITKMKQYTEQLKKWSYEESRQVPAVVILEIEFLAINEHFNKMIDDMTEKDDEEQNE